MPCPESALPEESDHGNDPGLSLFRLLATWRKELARSIARNNFGIRSDEIAEAVNRIIFFLVLLRIGSDRGFVSGEINREISLADDPYRTLLGFAHLAGDPWEDLGKEPSAKRPHIKDLVLEKRVARTIFTQALISDDTSGFSTYSTGGLGSVFSWYLEQTVKRSAAHQATVVDTRETILSSGTRRPSEGMIQYMVENTLCAAGRNRSKYEILPLRIADPACGSGEVLLAAFREIVREHGGNKCTFAEKRQILFDSIHGLESDRHAIAAARTLLVIGLLEGETAGSLPGNFFAVIHDVYQDLRYTIRLGNALISPEILQDDGWMFLPPRERHELNPFSWKSGFPEIFAAGGFDAVLGIFPRGPPGSKAWIHPFLQRNYAVYDEAIDRSAYYVELVFSILRPGGILGCCLSNKWLRGRTGGSFRAFLRKKQIVEIVDFSATAGSKSDSGLCIMMVANRSAPADNLNAVIVNPAFRGDINEYAKVHRFPVDPAALTEGGWVLRDTRRENLCAKLASAGTRLESVVMGQVHAGMAIDPAFVIDSATRRRFVRMNPRCKSLMRPIVSGGSIGRFRIDYGDRFVIFIPRGWTDTHPASAANPWRWFRKRFPALAHQLKQSVADKNAPERPEDYWWEGGGFDKQPKMQPGIIFPEEFRHLEFAYDNGRLVADETVNVIESSSFYLLGLLNSRLVRFILGNSRKDGAGMEYFSRSDLMEIPVYTPDLDEPADRDRHERMCVLVRRFIDRKNKLRESPDEPEAVRLRKEIAALEKKINVLVYNLYHLTKEEIEVIESDSPLCDPSS